MQCDPRGHQECPQATEPHVDVPGQLAVLKTPSSLLWTVLVLVGFSGTPHAHIMAQGRLRRGAGPG